MIPLFGYCVPPYDADICTIEDFADAIDAAELSECLEECRADLHENGDELLEDLYFCWRKERCEAISNPAGSLCSRLQEYLDALDCDPGAITCEFITFCADSEWDCDDLQAIIDCVEEEIGCALTEEQAAAIATCLGCEPPGCCHPIDGSTAEYASCSTDGAVQCDQDCDGDVDCDDLRAFVNAAEACTGEPLERDEIIDVVCVYMEACGAGNGDLCDEFMNCLEGILREHLGEETEGLSNEEYQHFNGSEGSCTDCGGGGGGGEDPLPPCAEPPVEDEDGDDMCDGPNGDGCDGCGDASGQHSSERNAFGTELRTGDQMLSATDVSISVDGEPFNISRAYRSNPDYECEGGVGNKWTLSEHRWLEYDSGGGTVTLRGLASTAPQMPYNLIAGGEVAWPGPNTKTLNATNDGTDDVWRIREPGRWEEDYYRDAEEPALEGRLKEFRDAHGNKRVYTYLIYVVDEEASHAILTRIDLFNKDNTKQAVVHFRSDLNRVAPTIGNIREIRTVRFNSGQGFTTEYVWYTYVGDVATSADVGIAGDLAQVIRRTRVDRDASGQSLPWREEITQYRYHREEGGSAGARDYVWDGVDSQVKMVIEAEQVEFWAQVANASEDPPVLPRAAAEALLDMDDDAELWGTDPNEVLLVDLAATVYEDYSGDFLNTMYAQSNCGCGGTGASGIKVTNQRQVYTPSGGNTGDGWSMRTTESEWDEGETEWVIFRRTVYDIERQGPDPAPDPDERDRYLVNKVVQGDFVEGIPARQWVTRYIYDEDTRRQAYEYTPAAITSYALASGGSPPTVDVDEAAGLVHGMEHDGDKRLVGRYVIDGFDISSEDLDDFTQIEGIEYGDADGGGSEWDIGGAKDNARDHLVSRRTRHRTGSGSPTADELEVTKFYYGFHAADAIAWIETVVEAELAGENGPGGTFHSYQLLDTAGRGTWSRAADGSLTKVTFDADTGAVTSVTRNHDGTGLPSGGGAYDGMTDAIGDWDTDARHADGGLLTTTYIHDLLGRVQATIGPSGVASYTLREMRAWPQRPGLLYYATVSLPHEYDPGETTAKHAGPASVTWHNAGGAAIGSSQFDLADEPYGAPVTTGYTLEVSDWNDEGTELARSAVVNDVTGKVTERIAWHDVAGNRSYTTRFEYDLRGRLEYTFSPVGTVTQQVYDVRDRVIETKVGIEDAGEPSGMLTVAQTFYDGIDGGGDPDDVQGVGNGNVTFVKQYIDGSTTRATKYWHDFRDRGYKTVNALPPHDFIVFDNLDRAIERGVFTTEPDAIDDDDRLSYSRTFHSQRGLVYLTQTAIDPDAETLEYLESHSWFDEVGRTVASWSPTGPAQRTTYDGLGRAVVIYTCDHVKTEVGSGSYAEVYDAANHEAYVDEDVVFQETHTRYIEDDDYTDSAYAGLVDLMTTHLRTHAAVDADTGDLASMKSDAGDDVNVITTYAATFYDEPNRPIRSVNYGTNLSGGWVHDPSTSGDPVPTVTQESEPDWDTGEAWIVTHTDYGARGLVERTTDPKGFETKVFFDDLSRQIAVVENWDNVAIDDWNETDERWDLTGFALADQQNARGDDLHLRRQRRGGEADRAPVRRRRRRADPGDRVHLRRDDGPIAGFGNQLQRPPPRDALPR